MINAYVILSVLFILTKPKTSSLLFGTYVGKLHVETPRILRSNAHAQLRHRLR